MQIVPAIYIHDDKAAIYRPGDYDNLEYLAKDPYEVIQSLDVKGISRILIIDINASIPGEKKNNKGLIGSLSNTCVADIEVGGGINDMEYLKSLQYAGVDNFVLGSVVYDNFDFVKQLATEDHVKNEDILISIDVQDGKLFYHGWNDPVEDLTAEELMYKCINIGLNSFNVTDVKKDADAPNFEYYEKLIQQFPGATIGAAGNIHTLEDVEKLEALGVREIYVGNRIYKEPALVETIAAFNLAREEN